MTRNSKHDGAISKREPSLRLGLYIFESEGYSIVALGIAVSALPREHVLEHRERSGA
jgi:hypothetical protein